MAIITVKLNNGVEFTITQREEGGAAAIKSTFDTEHDDSQYSAALDGVESLILSMYCEGIDVTRPSFIKALETTLEAIDNNYG